MNKYSKTKNNPIRTSIYLCWATLIICLISKIFFPEMFSCICQTPRFNFICNFINTNIIAKAIFIFILNFILLTPYTLSIYKAKWFSSKFQSTLFILFLILNSILKATLTNAIPFMVELVLFVFYPTIYILYDCFVKDMKRKQIICACFRPIIFYIIFQVFLIASFFIRNTQSQIKVMDNIFLNFIYSLDTFILAILYYLYKIKKEMK